jgi:hypothetical protein
MNKVSIAVGHVEELQEASLCYIHGNRPAIHRVVIKHKAKPEVRDLCEKCYAEYGQYFLTEVASHGLRTGPDRRDSKT